MLDRNCGETMGLALRPGTGGAVFFGFFSDLRGEGSGHTVVTANLLLPHTKTAGGRPWPQSILFRSWEAGKATR